MSYYGPPGHPGPRPPYPPGPPRHMMGGGMPGPPMGGPPMHGPPRGPILGAPPPWYGPPRGAGGIIPRPPGPPPPGYASGPPGHGGPPPGAGGPVPPPPPGASSSLLNPAQTYNVFVGKLPLDLHDSVIRNLLEQCGPVTKWQRSLDPVTSKPKAFGYCTYSDAMSVIRAVKLLNKLKIDSQEVLVKVDSKTQAAIDQYKSQQKAMGVIIDDVKLSAAEERIKANIMELLGDHAGVDPNSAALLDGEEATIMSEIGKFRKQEEQRKRELEEKRMEMVREQMLRAKASEEKAQEEKKADEEKKAEEEKSGEAGSPPDSQSAVANLEAKLAEISSAVAGKAGGEEPGEQVVKNDGDTPASKRRRESRSRSPRSRSRSNSRGRFRRDRRGDRRRSRSRSRDFDRRGRHYRSHRRRSEERYGRRRSNERGDREGRQRRPSESEAKPEVPPAANQHEEEENKEETTGAPPTAAPLPPANVPAESKPVVKVVLGLSKPASKKAKTASNAFAAEEEAQAKPMKAIVPIDYTEEEKLAAAPMEERLAAFSQKFSRPNGSSTKLSAKELIDKIPIEKDKLFALPVDWETIKKLVEKKLTPWIQKKIIEYLGEANQPLEDFVASQLKKAAQPQSILDELTPVLDNDAAIFVTTLWRKLIFEAEWAAMYPPN